MTNSPVTTVIEAALYFAERGFRVFPVKAWEGNGERSDGKLPIVKLWQTVATTDVDQIARWFMLEHKHANFGVVVDKLIVLDVDTLEHSGGTKDGLAELAKLEAIHGNLPDTLTVRTASGGLHYYFADRSNSGNTYTKGADKLGPALDIQTGNAFMVGPMSVINGNQYEIVTAGEIADLPHWIAEAIKDVYVERPARRPAAPSDPVNNKYVQAAITGELARLDDCQRSGWNGPAWDETTFNVACNLIEIANTPNSGYDHGTAYRDFLGAAPTDAKFGPSQHEKKWHSAIRKVGNASRSFPAPKTAPVKATDSLANVGPTVAVKTSQALPPAPPAPPAQLPATMPEDFFGKHGLMVAKLAQYVKYDLALGPDLELWRYEDGIFQPDSMELMRRVTQLLGDRYRPGHYNAVKDFVSSLPGMPQLTNEQPDSRYIILANGVYSWRERALLPHSPDYGAITQLPVVFDSEAECPEFDRYLAEVVPPDTLDLVWEMIGYMLMFGNPYQLAFILQGPGGNGKSLFLRVLQALIGKKNISALSLRQITEDRFAVAGLLGKTANLAGDIDSKYLGDSSRFKQVVGGDLIEVERKYGQPFSFEPYVVPVFAANEFWKTGDTTHGYWRRWVPIPFPYPVVGKRQLNEEDLFAETSGIFNRAMVGLRILMQRGKFEMSPSVNSLFDVMEASADVLADWFDEDESIIVNDPAYDAVRSPRTEVYEAFQRWCRSSGHKGMSSTNFYKRLAQLGFTETKIRGQRNFVGLELAPYLQPHLSGA